MVTASQQPGAACLKGRHRRNKFPSARKRSETVRTTRRGAFSIRLIPPKHHGASANTAAIIAQATRVLLLRIYYSARFGTGFRGGRERRRRSVTPSTVHPTNPMPKRPKAAFDSDAMQRKSTASNSFRTNCSIPRLENSRQSPSVESRIEPVPKCLLPSRGT